MWTVTLNPDIWKRRSGNNSDNPSAEIIANILFNGGVMWKLASCIPRLLCGGVWVFFFKYFWLIFCNDQLKLNSQKTETIYISPLTRWEGQSFHIYKFYLIHSLLWVLSGSLLCLSCFAVVRSNSTSTRILHILPVCFETVIPTLSVPFGLPDFQEVSHWKNLKISG